jgi:colanic acid biosynthesis glycosyl transferase WcaI
VLASVDPGTEVARTIERADAGVAVEPDDPAAFLGALRGLLADAERAATLGTNGRTFVESWASPSAVAASYGELFRSLRRSG